MAAGNLGSWRGRWLRKTTGDLGSGLAARKLGSWRGIWPRKTRKARKQNGRRKGDSFCECWLVRGLLGRGEFGGELVILDAVLRCGDRTEARRETVVARDGAGGEDETLDVVVELVAIEVVDDSDRIAHIEPVPANGSAAGGEEISDDSIQRGGVPMTKSGDWTILLLCSAILAASMILSVRDETQVVVPILGKPLPPLCTFKRFTGHDCPGCGLTRAFICLGHGQPWRAWAYNPSSWFLFPLFASQIPFRVVQLRRRARGLEPYDLGFWGVAPLIVLMIVVLGQWLVRAALGQL